MNNSCEKCERQDTCKCKKDGNNLKCIDAGLSFKENIAPKNIEIK